MACLVLDRELLYCCDRIVGGGGGGGMMCVLGSLMRNCAASFATSASER